MVGDRGPQGQGIICVRREGAAALPPSTSDSARGTGASASTRNSRTRMGCSRGWRGERDGGGGGRQTRNDNNSVRGRRDRAGGRGLRETERKRRAAAVTRCRARAQLKAQDQIREKAKSTLEKEKIVMMAALTPGTRGATTRQSPAASNSAGERNGKRDEVVALLNRVRGG